jgi:hypothetical protein
MYAFSFAQLGMVKRLGDRLALSALERRVRRVPIIRLRGRLKALISRSLMSELFLGISYVFDVVCVCVAERRVVSITPAILCYMNPFYEFLFFSL